MSQSQTRPRPVPATSTCLWTPKIGGKRRLPRVSRLLFVTGFPGFIGRRLVRGLLDVDAEARIVALVEEKQLDRARDTAAAIAADRIELLTGDISKPDLGLDASTRERLGREVVQVFHLAAIYNLAVPLEVAQRINVDGTGNILDLCAACTSARAPELCEHRLCCR